MTVKKKVRLKNIADEAGVSVSAVSMALADSPQISDETKIRVREIAQRLGYVNRRASKRNRSRNTKERKRFGFIAVGKPLEDESLAAMLNGLASHAIRQRVRVEIAAFTQGDDDLAAIEDYIQDLDGVLLYGLVTPELAALVHRHGLPSVALGPILPVSSTKAGPDGVHCVYGDMVSMGRLAVSWLVAQGHRRIAFVAGRMPEGMYAASWYDGYRLAMLDSGLTVDPDLIKIRGDKAAGAAPTMEAMIHGLHEQTSLPTAFVLPDIHAAAEFLNVMDAMNWHVDPRSVVLGARLYAAQRYGMETAPVITEDADQITAAAIELLLQHANTFGRVDIIVPFLTLNLD